MGWAARANPNAQAVKRGELSVQQRDDERTARAARDQKRLAMPLAPMLLGAIGMSHTRIVRFLSGK